MRPAGNSGPVYQTTTHLPGVIVKMNKGRYCVRMKNNPNQKVSKKGYKAAKALMFLAIIIAGLYFVYTVLMVANS